MEYIIVTVIAAVMGTTFWKSDTWKEDKVFGVFFLTLAVVVAAIGVADFVNGMVYK